MKNLRVPQIKIQVRLRLVDGRALEGTMFVPPVGPYGGPGQLIDRLNASSGSFIPLAEEGRTELIHRDHVLVAESLQGEEDGIQTGRHLQVEIRFVDGSEIQGHLSYLPEEDHERLQDFLNSAHRFLPLTTPGGVAYICRDAITSVVALQDEGDD